MRIEFIFRDCRAVCDEIIAEHFEGERPFDMVLLAGDVSYATVDPPNGELQWTWDGYGIQVEPFAATAPFMISTGEISSSRSHFD